MQVYKEVIRSKGLKATPARVAVLRILEDSSKPLDISTIIKMVSEDNVFADQATIYRIIENFLQKDLARRLQFHENKFFYEANRIEHHHAICESCGKIEDVSNCSIGRVEREIEKKSGFTVKTHSLEFFGICNNCNSQMLQ